MLKRSVVGTSNQLGDRSILMVGNFVSGATYSSVCGSVSNGLADAGWHVVRTSYRRRALAKLLDMLAVAWKHKGQYRIANVEVYSGRAFIWAEAVCLLLRVLCKPYFLTLHGGNLPAFSRRWPNRCRWLLQSARAVTVPSSYLRETLSECRPNMVIIPNPIDLQRYKFIARSVPRPRLVWLRAFERLYNPTLALRVLSIIKREFPDASLLMIGRDKQDGSLQQTRELARSSGLTSSVEIIAGVPKSEVPAYLQKADIFLNTSNVDNAPVSVIEAMACGLCVVSTNVGGVAHLLDNESDSLLVPPDEPQIMADAVRRILNEPGFSLRLSRNAREKVETSDWSALLPQWESLLLERQALPGE